MKTKYSGSIIILFVFSSLLFLVSCKKEISTTNPGNISQAAVTATQSIAVAAGTSAGDSIYVLHTCAENDHLDTIAMNNLPSAITNYLSANYSGYTFQKAYTDKDSSGILNGYVVIIQFNGSPVGLKFDASGNFIKVLEQREGHDLTGNGWHEGGRFSNRDGRHTDTVQLAALPPSILSYFTANYPQDTLVRAYINHDSSFIIFSKNNGAFVTVFTSAGTFVKRNQLQPDNEDNVISVTQSALPFVVQTYLTTTYPNYVFDQAFSFSVNGNLAGYIVALDANGTKYAVEFDAAGNFVKAVTIR